MQASLRGTLVAWKPDKGFGFIRPDEGGKDVFVHLSDFGGIPRAPRIGDVIRYQRVSDGQGRVRAADVHVAGLIAAPALRRNQSPGRLALFRADRGPAARRGDFSRPQPSRSRWPPAAS